MNQIILAFITGLTTGGISCLAVQGGLLASSLTQDSTQKDGIQKGKFPIISTFLLFKILAYTILGFGLGLLGASFNLTPKVQGLFQIIAGIFMLITFARLLDIHPIFRYFVIQPPKFAFRLLKNESKLSSYFAPALLGLSTILIPCGITQAIMLVAIASGNPVSGALIMFAFILGTSPLFFLVGATISQFLKKRAFVYLSGFIIFVMGISSVNSGIGLMGSIYTLQNLYKAAISSPGNSTKVLGQTAQSNYGKQYATIYVQNNGYSSNTTNLKAGIPVVLTLITQNTQSCSRAFVIPEFNIRKILPTTGTETIEFTPSKTGPLAYTCSMGMYTGTFTVIN